MMARMNAVPVVPPARAERLFRASGVAPLGAFVLLHVLGYAEILFGRRHFGDVDATRVSLWAFGLELVLVLAPLTFHGSYGLYLLARRPARAAVGTTRLLDRLQRYSSLLVFAFIVDHYARFRWPMLEGSTVSSDAHSLLVRELSSTSQGVPVVAAFHLLGIGAVAFHLGYGIYRFDWQRLPWADRRKTWLAIAIGLLVLIPASFAVVELATGKKLVPAFG